MLTNIVISQAYKQYNILIIIFFINKQQKFLVSKNKRVLSTNFI